ncbi:arsenite efflux ATP-binding protein ArsA [Pseudonocardia endophytica]|uniref:Arsenite efflux ATP-binding protein ArsA n=1 Tax=Pseudonocardia endophytica TaxID=401976 RepID=A0A4R1HWE0_PSEEN|nr:arsenite efflux ATP-binding protein ArsA [Pseudonocardia endophytica]
MTARRVPIGRADGDRYAPGVRVVLFTGKGGVGKTTLAAATAAMLSGSGRKVLVVSTDPAHSLGDALGTELGPDPTEIEPSLFAAHIDARVLLEGAWGDLQEHLRTIIAGAGVDELVADELTVLPGVEDLLALAEVQRLADSGEYDVLVVDCGPTAETLRLLTLPEALAGYLERLFPAHRRAVRGLVANLAGAKADGAGWERTVDALGLLAEQLSGLREMLGDRSRTSIRLVLTPERVVAAETRRTLTALALHELRVDALVANRVMPGPPPSLRGPAARWLRERHGEQQAVLAELAQLGGDVPVHAVRYTAAEPTGTDALRELARSLYGDDDPVPESGPTGSARPLLQLKRTAGHGVSADSEFEMTVALPGSEDAPLDLARVGDEMVIGLGMTRRVVALPSVLRRCEAVGAQLVGSGRDARLEVTFRPDPKTWMT